jgi:hypothetical protein
MSFAGAAGVRGSSRAGGSDWSGGCKRGHPLGICNKDKSLVVALSVPCKRGRLLGIRNKKNRAALASAAATVSTEAATTAVASNSSDAVTGVARQSRRLPKKQQPAYTSVNGYTTFLVPLRARSEERLPLPFKFVDTMEGEGMMQAIMEECSSG